MIKKIISAAAAAAVFSMQLFPSMSAIVYAELPSPSAMTSEPEKEYDSGENAYTSLPLPIYDDTRETADNNAADTEYPSDDLSSAGSVSSVSSVIESVTLPSQCTKGTVLAPAIRLREGHSIDEIAGVTVTWSVGSAAVSGNTYTVTEKDVSEKADISVSVSCAGFSGVITSDTVTACKAEYSSTVLSPGIADITDEGFTVVSRQGYEYFVGDTSALPENAAWTSLDEDAVIGNLTLGVTYYVFVRVAETEETLPSQPQQAAVTPRNHKPELSVLSLSEGLLSPDFQSDIHEYTAIVPVGAGIPKMEYVTSDTSANAAIVTEGGVSYITVANSSGAAVYTVRYSERERSSAPLIAPTTADEPLTSDACICISGADSDADIYYTTDSSQPDTYSAKYTAPISLSQLSLPADNTALTVKAIAVERGKAESAVAIQEYTLKDTSPLLNNILINGKPINDFSSAVFDYTYSLPYESWANNPDASYTVTADTNDYACAVTDTADSFSLTVSDPDTPCSKSVKISVSPSSGGDAQSIYTVTFTVEPCSHFSKEIKTLKGSAQTDTGLTGTVCTVCGKVFTATEIAAADSDHTHEYAQQWKYDNTSHWRECTLCGDRTLIASHTEDGGSLNPDNGVTAYRCTECGFVMRTETESSPEFTQTSISSREGTSYTDSIADNNTIPEEKPDTAYSGSSTVSIDSRLAKISQGNIRIETRSDFFERPVTISVSNTSSAVQAGKTAADMLRGGSEHHIVYPFDIKIFYTDDMTPASMKSENAYITFEIPVPDSLADYTDRICVYQIKDGSPKALPGSVVMSEGVTRIRFTGYSFSPYMFTAYSEEEVEYFSSTAGIQGIADTSAPSSGGANSSTAPVSLCHIRRRKFRVVRIYNAKDAVFIY